VPHARSAAADRTCLPRAYLAERQGSYVVWPYMATTVGLGFLWAAVLSVTVQYFLNMEIER